MLWPQNFKKYNLLCWYEEDFFFWGGGLVVCRWGELGLGRRRRNRGREGQQSWHVHIYIYIYIYINSFRRFHRRTLRRWFWRTHKHVIVRICHFKSLGESVGNLNGEPVTSLYGLSFWVRWKKITSQNLHVSDPPFFLIRKLFRS